MTEPPHAATPDTVLVFRGLQRSGNHAVLNWIGSLFPAFEFHNNVDHDLFNDPANLQALVGEGTADVVAISFEDDRLRARDQNTPLPGSLGEIAARRFPSSRIEERVILRDPFNTWASRVAAYDRLKHGGWRISSVLDWEMFRESWLKLAKSALEDRDSAILFNRWNKDEAYRRTICAALGGTYSEETLNRIATQGKGSSFDGLPRPSYSSIARNWSKYVNGKFARRLLARPGHYLSRLVQPPIDASKLATGERWQSMIGREEGKAMFADDELFEITCQLFESYSPLTRPAFEDARSRALSGEARCGTEVEAG